MDPSSSVHEEVQHRPHSSGGNHNNPISTVVQSSSSPSCRESLAQLNDAKLKSIHSFLDDVESTTSTVSAYSRRLPLNPCTNVSLSSMSVKSSFCHIQPIQPDYHGQMPLPLAPPPVAFSSGSPSIVGSTDGTVFSSIKEKLDTLRTEKEQLSATLKSLNQKSKIAKQKEEQRISNIQEVAMKNIDELKKEHSAAFQQQVRHMEDIVDDKMKLAKKVEALEREVRVLQDGKEGEKRRLEDAHAAALSQMKGQWQVQEKRRREQWAKDEAKKIHDNTVKSMEPDIVALLNRHRAEKHRMEQDHQDAIKRKDDILAAKEREVMEVRSRLSRDADEILMKERETHHQRLDDYAQRAQKQQDEMRRVFSHERELSERSAEDQKQSLLKEVRRLEEMLAETTSRDNEFRKEHRDILREEKEKLIIERDAEISKSEKVFEDKLSGMRETLRSEMEKELQHKGEELEAKSKAQRDREISLVISSLEEDQLVFMKETKEKEKKLSERCSKLERELSQTRVDSELAADQSRNATAMLKQRETELASIRKQLEGLQETLTDTVVVHNEQFDERLRQLDQAWQKKVSSLVQQHRDELEIKRRQIDGLEKERVEAQNDRGMFVKALEQKHGVELESINHRVLQVLTKKDAQIRDLSEQLITAEMRVRQFEGELERHKQLLLQ